MKRCLLDFSRCLSYWVAPIAIQAYQALRVKVVSIDLLVTIAVIGAFIIKNVEESAIVTFFLIWCLS